MIGEDKTRVVITITKDMKEELDLLAKNDMRNISNYIATVLVNHISTLPEDKKNLLQDVKDKKRKNEFKNLFNK